MDEKRSNRMKMVKLDETFGDKKLSFRKKIAKIRIFEKKSPSGNISPEKEILMSTSPLLIGFFWYWLVAP
jgi:hypothetical protein